MKKWLRDALILSLFIFIISAFITGNVYASILGSLVFGFGLSLLAGFIHKLVSKK